MTDYLTVNDHNRDVHNLKYIYPVVSRRAGGVSIGINLNTNNACNWRCIYCQVPNLKRGSPEAIDIDLLTSELRLMLHAIMHGDFMQQFVASEDRQLQDIAFSGNGEPTSAKQFPQIVAVVETLLSEFDLLHQIKVRLITNGSMVYKPAIVESLQHLARINGEVWFKLDAGSQADILRINDVSLNPDTHLQHLKTCAKQCPTWVQTCTFDYQQQGQSIQQQEAYLSQLETVKDVIEGVHLYGVARPSHQPEAKDISPLTDQQLLTFAEKIRALGITVNLSS